MPRKKRKHPRGQNHGRELSPAQQELVVQTFAVTNNVRETARQCRISEKTAHKYIKKAVPSEIQAARIEATKALAGKVHSKTVAIIDSISPEDLESGRIPIYGPVDEATGERPIIGYRQYGPTLMQKVTSAAILTDKLKILHEMEALLGQGTNNGELLIPGDIKSLVAGIRGKVKSLSILNLRFAEDNPELSQKVQETLARAEAALPADAEVLDFDNPEGAEHAPVSSDHTDQR